MQITGEFIEELLWEEEGTTLDFKRDQYLFEGATNDQKSELLKDILAFANAFRRSDAFILIGVDEVKGGRSNIVGLLDQLDDAKLQQFVNSKTNRPVTFSHREFEIDGHHIGVIHIPLQHRPIYLKKGYGKLEKDTVYLRRGSSTGEASPDEVAQMGADRAVTLTAQPALTLQFYDRETGQLTGQNASASTLRLTIPPPDQIPDHRTRSAGFMEINVNHTNSNYYRELAEFTQTNVFFKAFTFALTNSGDVSAQDVRFVLEIEDADGLIWFIDESDMPSPPRSETSMLDLHRNIPTRFASDVDARRIGNTWHVECQFGKLQPQETARLGDDLFIGRAASGPLVLDGKLYADNLSRPVPVQLTIEFTVEERTVDLDDIRELERTRLLQTPRGRELLEQIEREKDD